METKRLNFSGRELPSSLGYGILDENSITYENDIIKADYVLGYDRSVVHKVTWQNDRCELKTLLHGESCGTSWYQDLNKALTSDFLLRNLADDKVFDFLTEKTCGAGNIYVQKPEPKGKGQRVVYFPAALLMCFRLPITDKTTGYDAFLETIKETGQIGFYRERRSLLLLADVDLNVTPYPFVLAEFIVPLAYMTIAAGTFAESGLIDPRRQFRMMIMDALQVETTFMQFFIEKVNHPYFGICFHELPEEKHPEMVKIFSNSIKGLYGRVNQ